MDRVGRHGCRTVLRPEHPISAELRRFEHQRHLGVNAALGTDSDSWPLQRQTTVNHYPDRMRLPTHGLEPGRFQIAYGVATDR